MDAAAEQFGDRVAYVDGDERITFAEWLRAADAVAADLVERGVRPGDVVALMLPPSIDFAVAYAAAVKAGAVATALNTRLGEREVAAILERCAPILVIRDEALGLPAVPPRVPVVGRTDLDDRRAGPRRRAPAAAARRPGRHRLDERHHRAAQGRVVRPSGPAGRRRHGRGDGGALRPPAGADALRPRRLPGQAVGAAGVGHHRRDRRPAVDRRGDAPPARRRAHHRRRRGADAVVEGRRAARPRGRRPVGASAVPERDRAGTAGAGGPDDRAAGRARGGPLRHDRVALDHRHRAR